MFHYILRIYLWKLNFHNINTSMFITQEIKNKKRHKINHKRLSFIISEKRYSLDQQNFIAQKKNAISHVPQRQIQKKLQVFGHAEYYTNNVTPNNQFIGQCKGNLLQNSKPVNFHIRAPKKCKNYLRKMREINSLCQADLCKFRQKPYSIVVPTKNVRTRDELSQLLTKNVANLREENIKKLQTLIKGAYHTEIDQYSQFVNLSSIDQCRKDFYIFDNLYRWTSETNQNQKMTIREVSGQNLKGVVYINDQKQNTSIPQLSGVMRKSKINH